MSSSVFQELRIRAQLDPVVRRKLTAYPLQFLANFDLSFDEKRQLVLLGFSWILEGKLAAMPFPATEDAYVVLQQLGIKIILNLTGYVDDAPQISAIMSLRHLLRKLYIILRMLKYCLQERNELSYSMEQCYQAIALLSFVKEKEVHHGCI